MPLAYSARSAHPFGLLQQHPRMIKQCPPGFGGLHALPPAMQQRRAECRLHVADACAGGGNGQMHALGAMGDAARLDDELEKPEIGQVEAHWPDCTFGLDEWSLR